MPKTNWTPETIVARLREVGAAHGRWLSTQEWRKKGLSPQVVTVYSVMGSWTKAWAAAGYEIPQKWVGRSREPWQREQIVAVLQQVAGEFDGPISTTLWDSMGLNPTVKTIRLTFGGWQEAWVAAGYTVMTPSDTDLREEVLQGLRELATRTGKRPTMRDWHAQGCRPSIETIQQTCGSWKAAVDAAGQEVARRRIGRELALVPWGLILQLPAREQAILHNLVDGDTLQTAAAKAGVTYQLVGQIARRVLRAAQAQQSA